MISWSTTGLAAILLVCVITRVNCDGIMAGVSRTDTRRPSSNWPKNYGRADRPENPIGFPDDAMPNTQGDGGDEFKAVRASPHPDGMGTPKDAAPSTSRRGGRRGPVDPSEENVEDGNHEDEANLCQGDCLCNHDDSVVSCEHEHVEEEHSDKHNLTLSAKRLPKNVETIRLIGFDELEVLPDTFANRNSTVIRIIFKGIGKLVLHPGSLRFHSQSKDNVEIQVTFEDCIIPEIPEGAITQDIPKGPGKDHIDLNLEETRFITVEFTDCTIDIIKTNAIVNTRFLYFHIRRSRIAFMEERSIDVDVYEEFQLKGTTVSAFPKNSICILTDGVVIFSSNIMEKIESFAFNITSDSQVLFEYNYVKELDSHALLGILPKEKSRGSNIVFLNNTVDMAQPEGLVISNKYPPHERKVQNNRFNTPCLCNITEVIGSYLGTMNYKDSTFLAVMGNSLCSRGKESGGYQGVQDFMDEECSALPLPIIISTVLVVVMILVTAGVIFFCSRRLKQVKEESCYFVGSPMPSFSTIQSYPAQLNPGQHAIEGPISPSWIMAVPEVKTYQETEVHVLYEQTEPINSSRVSYHDSTYDNHKKCQARASCPFN